MGTNAENYLGKRMEKISLKQAMNNILQQMKTADCSVANKKTLPCTLTEIDAYSTMDPVLKSLRKQHFEAKAQYKELVELRCTDDPLAEMATDWMESTESAIETRMIELRCKRKLKAMVAALMKASREKIEAANRKTSLAYKKRLMEFELGLLTENQAKEASEEGALNIAILLMLLDSIIERTRNVMSLVSAFADASLEQSENALPV